jgi:hypothetical protein
MPEMTWYNAVEILEPHIVRISTPRGSGSGFLIANGRVRQFCMIATAAHVVEHAHFWEEPIRIDHVISGTSRILRRDVRAIFLDASHDTAAVFFHRGDLQLPPDPLQLAPKDSHLKVGNQIGWLGFPAIPTGNLCFFSGSISAWIDQQKLYFVDGVAINGISGGPAFSLVEGDPGAVVLAGVVSAYMPNRATGEVLPGLSVVQDVSQFHDLAPAFASLDEAREAETPAVPPPASAESETLPGTSPTKSSNRF